jgi:uncharacterized protein YecE (DUF72 family)
LKTTNEQIQKQNEAACVSVALHEREDREKLSREVVYELEMMRLFYKQSRPNYDYNKEKVKHLESLIARIKAAL